MGYVLLHWWLDPKKMFVVVLVIMMYRLFLAVYSDVCIVLMKFFVKPCAYLFKYALLNFVLFCVCLLTVSFCALLDGPKVPEEPEVLKEEQQEER
jgi:hypothetical protein